MHNIALLRRSLERLAVTVRKGQHAGLISTALVPAGAAVDPGTSSNASRSKLHKQLSKILQVDVRLGLLVEEISTGKMLLVHTTLPCPLQVGNRGTAKTLAAMLKTLKEVPLLQNLINLFPITLHLHTRDRASANLRAEAAERVERGWVLGFPCFVHNSNSAIGKAMALISQALSGAIAFGLAQRPLGVPAMFRASIVKVLVKHAKPVPGGIAHLPDSDEAKHRKLLLDLWAHALGDNSMKAPPRFWPRRVLDCLHRNDSRQLGTAFGPLVPKKS